MHPTCPAVACGPCQNGFRCEENRCIACDPILACDGLACGPGACGIDCGSCGSGFVCHNNQCITAPNGTCANPDRLQCNTNVSGTTEGALALFAGYSCVGWTGYGDSPEWVYLLTTPISSEATLNLTDMTADLDLFVLVDQCDPTSCITVSAELGPESVTFLMEADVHYYVVIDGYMGARSPFVLDTRCTPL